MEQPNILLVVLDTARAEAVIDRPDVTPNIHEIASEGTTFSNAFTTAPWTLPSHASMFTGQYTSDHGTHAGTKRFDPDVPTVAERLQSNGYQTVAFSNNTWVSPEFGFDRGFEEFNVGWQLFDGGADLARIAKEKQGVVDQSRAVGKKLFRRDGYKTLCNALYTQFLRKRYDDGAWMTNKRVKWWFDKTRDENRPFFMFINYLEPHLEYHPPRKFREQFLPDGVDWSDAQSVNQDAWAYIAGNVDMDEEDFEILRGLYLAELRYLDHRIGQLWTRMESQGVADETALIIVGDHGENLGEHGLMDHQYCLYDTLIHVPLVVRYPELFEAGTRNEGLVELRDLYPTMLDIADIDGSTEEDLSANSIANDDQTREHIIAEYVTPQPSMNALESRVGESSEIYQYDRGLRCLRTPDWKYIEGTDGSTTLYNVSNDPDEQIDVSGSNADTHIKLKTRLEGRDGKIRQIEGQTATGMKKKTQQRLEDLGYLQ
ncbi:sulfatase [Halalkalicoccus sp. NIPERK01]|uniref:sulfatase n=1 Tax=Halalkalicoccus sp. NIPERK01 TaxID=3053469 RepID=UPI00256F66CA|nr:sulfatase [Halalkalicoccus sp. NIPERK01]MDL5363427.1 sulfatase [Halalkalicoccus sp. NIPERK01]